MTRCAVGLKESEEVEEVDFTPIQEHELLRRSVREVLAAELPLGRVREFDESRTLPRDLWSRLGEVGWIGLSVPERYGGGGGDLPTAAVLVEELSRAFASLASDFVITTMASQLLAELGTETRKEELLPLIARGELRIALGMTEPSGGTDVLGLSTKATLQNGEWLIRGQKAFTSMAIDADYVLALARTDEPEPGHRARGLSLILTSTRQTGIEVRPLHVIALRAAGTSEVFFDDARAPADALLGERGRGFYHLLATLHTERILAAALALGIAGAAFDEALRYARERHAFGRPIGSFQAIQHYLSDTAIEIEGARHLVGRAAWVESVGKDCTLEAAMAKVAAAETAIRATDRGMRILAGHGVAEESAMQRYFRDARVGAFSPLSNEMARNIIGERLGLPRSY